MGPSPEPQGLTQVLDVGDRRIPDGDVATVRRDREMI